jgi:hypothetical protein
MSGKVDDGDIVTVELVDPATLDSGGVVLVRCRGSDYLHLIKARDGDRFLIGNNRGGTNGWVRGKSIYGKATRIERP